MLRLGIVILLCLPLFLGCATQPDKLGTTYVSPGHYSNYDCDQISTEMRHVSVRTVELYSSLEKKANNDTAQMAVGMILFWPTLFFLEGGDGPEAVEYSRLKGEYEALRHNAMEKNCNMADLPQSPEEIIASREAKKQSGPEVQEEVDKLQKERKAKDNYEDTDKPLLVSGNQINSTSKNNSQKPKTKTNDYLEDSDTIEQPKITIKGEKIKIGIIEFQSLNEGARQDDLGKIVTEILTTSFVNSEYFKIIEREQLQKIVKEIQMEQSGIIDASHVKKIGKFTGADAIVTGSVIKIGQDLRLDARVIDVETGIILSAEKSEGDSSLRSLSMMAENVLNNLIRKFYENHD